MRLGVQRGRSPTSQTGFFFPRLLVRGDRFCHERPNAPTPRRCRWRYLSVELSVSNPCLEDRAGAGVRKCGRIKPADLVPHSAWLLRRPCERQAFLQGIQSGYGFGQCRW